MKPSKLAFSMAQRRARARNRATGANAKRVSLNLLDVLKAMDRMDRRIDDLEYQNQILTEQLDHYKNQ